MPTPSPCLMLPREFVAAIYGPAALALVPGDDVAAHLVDALKRPEELLGRGAADARPSRFAALLRPRLPGADRAGRSPRPLRRGALNILFVMKHRGNAGNTHAVANYMRVAPEHGHSVAIYGTPHARTFPSCSSRPTSMVSTASSTCSSRRSTGSSRCRKR